jgi:predicted SnoaL-like aldol condensation-catalyzing enzyme
MFSRGKCSQERSWIHKILEKNPHLDWPCLVAEDSGHTPRPRKFGARRSTVHLKSACLAGLALLLLGTAPAWAQNPRMKIIPAPSCTTTPAQLAATKKAAMDELHTAGEPKLAFVDRGYIQHSPTRMKQAKEDKISDYEEFRKTLVSPSVAGGGQGGARQAAAVPQPPAGDTTEIVVAECDIVTIVRNAYRQDPTAKPGMFYEYFTFDTYRIKNGKVIEHWDGNVIAPPAASEGR